MADLDSIDPNDIPTPDDDSDAAATQPVSDPEAGATEDEDNPLPEDATASAEGIARGESV